MTNKELQDFLKTYPDEAQVIIRFELCPEEVEEDLVGYSAEEDTT